MNTWRHGAGAAVAIVALLTTAGAAAGAPAGPSTTDVIVVLDEEFAPGGHAANRARAAEIAREHGFEARQAYGTALFGFAATVPDGRLNGLARDPRVDYVDADAAVHALKPKWCNEDPTHPACDDGKGDDPEEPPATSQELPWGVDAIEADQNDGDGLGVHVYVLDTGIDSDHPDLATNLGGGHAVETCRGGRTCVESWDDDHGHGTHVAGTIAANDNDGGVIGVAPDATLHAVKVLSKSGSGSRSGVIAGIDWVTTQVQTNAQPAVVNMSLGGSGTKTGTCSTDGFSGQDAYHEAICDATGSGVVFAVAAGNEGVDASTAVPAAYDDAVITVSATSTSKTWPWWSNWGDVVDIAAPGVDILSTAAGGGTTTMSGTSMASPHVAGALALYLDSRTPPGGYANFTQSETALVDSAAPTTGWLAPDNTVHAEPFLQADEL